MSSKSLSTHSPVLCSNHTILTLYDRIRSLPDEILFTIFLYLPREYIPQQLWDTKYFKDKWVLCHVRISKTKELYTRETFTVMVDGKEWFVGRPVCSKLESEGLCEESMMIYTPGADSLVIKQEAENILEHVPFSKIQEDVWKYYEGISVSANYWDSLTGDEYLTESDKDAISEEWCRLLELKWIELEERELCKIINLICSPKSVCTFHYSSSNYYIRLCGYEQLTLWKNYSTGHTCLNIIIDSEEEEGDYDDDDV